MIFHRLRVSRFKGIRDVEIEFAPRGITLVEGPNEVGKSSLVQALTTLFETPFNKQRKSLEQLIPNTGDGTPEILLEAESGPYRFVYRKSYVENRAAELTVLAPNPERREGAAAQEAFERILAETLDRSLWKALMLQQGTAVGLPEVRDQQALMRALDNSAAGVAADAEGLFARVADECGKYFNAGHGGELQRLRDLRDGVGKAEADLADAQNRLAELEGRIAENRRLRHFLAELDGREKTERAALDGCAAKLAEIATVENALAGERIRLEQLGNARTSAERGLESRRSLAKREAEIAEALGRAAAPLEAAILSEAAARRVEAEARDAFEKCAREAAEAERLAALRRNDHDHRRDIFDLEQMRERKKRIDDSRDRVALARTLLETNAVPDKAAEEIRAAEREAALARARLESSAPKIRIEAVSPGDVVLNGVSERLTPDSARELAVTGVVDIEIPGRLSLRVTPGGGDPEEALAKAEAALEKILAAHGATDSTHAARLAERRRDAERAVADHRRVEAENLRDLAYSDGVGGLVERIDGLAEKTERYRLERTEAPAPAPDLDSADRERSLADAVRKAAAARLGEAETARRAAEGIRRAAGEALLELKAEADGLERDLRGVRVLLDQARLGAGDDELAEAYAKADGDFARAAAAAAVLEEKLRELAPEAQRDRLKTLNAAMAKTDRERAQTRDRLSGLKSELDILGGNGLDERAAEAEDELARREGLLRAELRRAEAARLLYGVVAEARERSRNAYTIPLRKRIEELARSVYARDVGIELTPDLQIAARTMDGGRVAFGQLSGGAREQFSLIHRAACSLAVAKDGGAPLILDDALGYSDAERLIGMNAVLSRAAERCQIIILTCMPGRYAYLEPAARIDMGEKTR